MTKQSFSIIAVDFSGNEHRKEWRGHSQGQAAEEMLRQHPNFRAALNGMQGSKNNPYRKLLRTQHGVEANAADTSLGQAFLEAQSTQSLQAGRMILSALQKKGLRLATIKENGVEKIVVTPKGMITPEECAEIDENQASIVALLRMQEEEGARHIPPATAPKETQRDIIRRMLPELPQSFIKYDLEQALNRCKYHDLADKSAKLDALLAWCATEGLIVRTGKGHYQRIPSPANTAPEPKAEVAQELPPPSPQSALEALFNTPSVIEQQAPVPVTVSETPTECPPEPPIPRSLARVLVDLTSELATVPIDESKLDAIERGAKELYESFERFMDPVDALIKQLRTNARARERLRTQLAAEVESNT